MKLAGGRNMKLWGGRFERPAEKRAEEFTSSLSFDRRLYAEDISGSTAHARMLGETGIIGKEEAAQIISGLRQVKDEIERGEFPFRMEFEDIHLNIEKRLTELIGPVAGKLHTARSRNDQIALDEHLFIRAAVAHMKEAVTGLQRVMVELCQKHGRAIMPGYTHMQRAQPTLFAHHMIVYFYMLERDYGRFADCNKRANVMPLGAGALAGTTFPIDPGQVARELGFDRLYENSMDAVSDRDHILEFLSAAAICASHLSRLAEELVFWATAEFGFVEMDDAYSTGSSIMPQKKNPDVLELMRGKTGRVYGNLVRMLTVMKGIPLAYDSDMQEDKEGLFDTVDTLSACLELGALAVGTMKVNTERMRESTMKDFSTATDVADYLAVRGVPFRQAHEIAGKIVRYCIDGGKYLFDLTLLECLKFSDAFDESVFQVIKPETSVARRNSPGGTAPEQVDKQVAMAQEILSSR
jgi:argininosuccinate lyase